VGDRQTPHEVDAIIRRAIGEKRLIRFWLGGHERIAEPHDYGIKSGVVQILVYQVGGSSNSGDLPDWRWVRLAKATQFQLLGDHFAGGRSIPTRRHSAWERLFLRVAPRS
jgi:hypothetical protein